MLCSPREAASFTRDVALAVWLVVVPLVAVPQALAVVRILSGPPPRAPISLDPSAGRVVAER